MKFNVKLEPVVILDAELLEAINNNREDEDLPLYESISEVPKEEIEKWAKNNHEYFYVDLLEYEMTIKSIEVID